VIQDAPSAGELGPGVGFGLGLGLHLRAVGATGRVTGAPRARELEVFVLLGKGLPRVGGGRIRTDLTLKIRVRGRSGFADV